MINYECSYSRFPRALQCLRKGPFTVHLRRVPLTRFVFMFYLSTENALITLSEDNIFSNTLLKIF